MLTAAPSLSSYDLGSHSVASTSIQSIAIAAGSAPTGESLQATFVYGTEFTLASNSCVATAGVCNVTVNFTPKYAGLRQDAIRLTDSGGNLMATGFLHGTGMGAQMVFNPGVVSVKDAQSSATYKGVVVDQTGVVYFARQNSVYQLSPGSSTPVLYAGQGQLFGPPGDRGPAIDANISPDALALDAAGNLFIEEEYDIRKVDHVTGIINTFFTTASGQGSCSAFGQSSLATDLSGDVFFLTNSNQVCKIDAQTGLSSVVAGNGAEEYSGDGGPALNAGLWPARAIVLDASGVLFIAESGRIRRVDPVTQTIETIAGTGTQGYTGDGGPATAAEIGDVWGLALDGSGNLYLADQANFVVRKVDTSTGTISTTAGTSTGNALATGYAANRVQLNANSIALDPAGNLYQTGVFGPLWEIASQTTSITYTAPGSFGTPPSQTLLLTNIGNSALQLASHNTVGPFSISPPASESDCAFPATVTPGAACSVNVVYVPALGTGAGTYSVATNALNGLTGNQTAALQLGYPTATLSLTSYNFGSVVVGGFVNDWVKLVNSSQVPLDFQSITVQGPGDFSVDTSSCASSTSPLPPVTQCTFDIMFTPQSAGAKSATIVLTDNAQNSPQTITVSGVGLAPAQLVVSEPSVLLNPVPDNSSSSQTVTLSNSGGVGLPLNYISVSGPFSLAGLPPLPSTLAPGASIPLAISFSPMSGQAGYGVLSVSAGRDIFPHTVNVMGTVAIPSAGSFDDRDPAIVYSGNWGQNGAPARYAGTQTFSNTAGDHASFTFNGTQVAYVYESQSNMGHVQVSIDDAVVTSDLDEYSPTLKAQQRTLYSGLPDGTHTITVTVLGRHDSASSSSYAILDAFLVGPAASAYDDTDPEIQYMGTWGHNTDAGRYLSTQSFSNQAQNTAAFTFTGTQVSYVYEAQSNMGHAQVSIDGTVVTPDLDEYSPTLLTQQHVMYSGLSAGTHTITVSVLATRDSSSSNSYVIVDAFLLGPPSSGTYDDTDPSVSYLGSWRQNTDVGRYLGTQTFSSTVGDAASFTFTGTQIAYIYDAQVNMGHAQISIDGVVVTPDLDEYSPTLISQQHVIYSGLSNGPHTIRVSVLGSQDSASSGSYVIVDAFAVAPVGSGTYDDADPEVSYVGSWNHNRDYERYAGTQSFSNTAGDSASFTFTGTEVAYVYEAQPNLGHVQVSIDGTVVTADLDEYSAFLQPQLRMIYSGLSNGPHTITITVLGTQDGRSTNSYATVDAFIVGPDAGAYDDADPAVSYSGIWNSNFDMDRYQGTQTFSNVTGDQASFTFTGTQIAYMYDAQANLGHAVVSIDGNVVNASLDEYSPTLLPQQQAVFSGLSSGKHTITVAVQGSKDAGSSDTYVIVDAFLVTP